MERTENLSFVAERPNKAGKGRPSVLITREQILLFFQEGYTAKKMSEQLSCSQSLIYKRLHEEGLDLRRRYSNLSNEEIKEKVRRISERHQNCGAEMMSGYLRSEGIFVQRQKIRLLMQELDPNGVANRWSRALKRRTYHVPTPNSLWHMDAHLKLARWGFVTHGCIDGYSRLIIYLQCEPSIQADPVVNMFVRAVKEHGLPSRVRSDHGYENLFVAVLMNLVRGMQRGSHITGKSVHNQRIERLWADVYKEAIDLIYQELYKLEDSGYLNPDNIIHRFCIQYIYVEVINMQLSSFMTAWNCHKIRTAQYKTPRQLWLDGMLENFNSNNVAVLEVFHEPEPIDARILAAFETIGIAVDSLNLDVPLEPSRFAADIDINDDQKLILEDIKHSTTSPKDKFLSCVNYLSRH